MDDNSDVFEGTVHKCPNCGEMIPAFTVKCPTCGWEFRDKDTVSSVKAFEKQIKEIEAKREARYISDQDGTRRVRTKEDEQLISLIRNYPVPNTKEDIIEFITMASANINSVAYIDAEEPDTDTMVDRDISEAWAAKTKQAYRKAEILFANDPDFDKVKQMYDDSIHEVKNAKQKATLKKYGAIIAWVILMLICVLAIFGLDAKEDHDQKALDSQLNAIVVDIRKDMDNKDWDAALDKCDDLVYDKDLDKQTAKKWDKKRKKLIRQIKMEKFKSDINPFD